MATLSFDTHDFVKSVTAAGMSQEVAEALLSKLRSCSLNGVATHENLLDIKEDIRRVDSKMSEQYVSTLRWMITLMLAQLGGLAALVKLL